LMQGRAPNESGPAAILMRGALANHERGSGAAAILVRGGSWQPVMCVLGKEGERIQAGEGD